MLRFNDFLVETFINLKHGEEKMLQHADHVYGMLQKAYEPVGGLAGFTSPQDMVKNIPMWKLHKKDGQIRAAMMYKDKEGRKAVAMASDGTHEGKKSLGKMLTDEFSRNRSYGELSDPALTFLKRHLPDGGLKKIAVHPDQVAKIAGEEIRKPPADDHHLKRHPELADHFYQRNIGGHWHTKLMIGQPGNKIF
jgi:hypothetical protein